MVQHDYPAASDMSARLTLYRATTFWSRFCGLYALSALSFHEGLYIAPCRAIHTVAMRYTIDVVFLDKNLSELKRVDRLRPYRVATCWHAQAVVELHAGYCQHYPDYLARIRQALLSESVPSVRVG